MKNVFISNVCGLCGGCKRAIDIALTEATKSSNVYLFKEIVHNKNVNKMLFDNGVKVVDDLNSAESFATIILRAHGEPKSTYEYLSNKNMLFKDATCINVENIHKAVDAYSKDGYQVIIIGKHNLNGGNMHPEVAGTIGWCNSNPILIECNGDLNKINKSLMAKFYLVCQTTFNENLADGLIETIKEIVANKKAELIINKSICSAQKNINSSSVELAKNVDLMVVIGGKNSSNTKELFKNVSNYTTSIHIEDISEFDEELKRINVILDKDIKIGVTAGASTLKEEVNKSAEIIQEKINKTTHQV